jgi:hypothetical protein
LSTVGILFNPYDKFDNNHPKYGVDNDDDSSNGVTQGSRVRFVRIIEGADTHFVFTVDFLMQLVWHFICVGVKFSLVMTEALISSRVISFLLSLVGFVVVFKFINGIILEQIFIHFALLILVKLIFFTAWMNWVFHLES